MKNKQFIELYKKYSKEILKFVYFKTSNKEDAEDLTSEVFAKLYSQDLNKINNVRAWLYKVARNQIYDKYIKDASVEVESLENYYEMTNTEEPAMEDIVLDSYFLDEILKKLKLLDNLSADIIIYKIWNDLKFKEIAIILNLKESTVKQRFYKGLDKVKSELKLKDKVITTGIIVAGVYQILNTKDFYFISDMVSNIENHLFNSLNLKVMSTENIASGINLPVTNSGSFFTTTIGKVVIGTVTSLAVVSTGTVGYFVLNSKDENIEKKADNVAVQTPTKSENIPSEVEPTKNCMQNYNNTNYPDLSFEYDSCAWTLAENIQKNSEGLDITNLELQDKQNAKFIFKITPITTPFGGVSLCGNEKHKLLKDEIGRSYNPKENYYYYYDNFLIKGTQNFTNYIGNGNVPPKEDFYVSGDLAYCHPESITFLTTSNLKTTGSSGEQLSISGIITAMFKNPNNTSDDTESLERADKIIQSMKF